MVQRKLPTNLKTENLFQHQDVKNNKGADLKKKMMKKSGSIKRPKQAGNPPPPPLPRQSPVSKTATAPNYMKPTTSSDARKEQSQSQVSTKSTHNSSILRRKSSDNSKLSLSSGKKGTKTLLARTLTKNPSFKPARASVRKCSPVVLCEKLEVQRTTCSSTLKDCKFPAYLSLNPGGTEAEGTSTTKVCPYTYCSLNGHHHHAPLPPLKCFLSARRRMIKSQRSIKLGCLLPGRVKPIGDERLNEEENKVFFIEIDTGTDGRVGDSSELVGGGDETEAAKDQEGVLETFLDAPICYDFDACNKLDQNGDVESMDIGKTYLSEENQEVEVDEEIFPPILVQEGRNPGSSNGLPIESKSDVHFCEHEDSVASDMDWETGYHSSLQLDCDYDSDCSTRTDIEPDPQTGTDENSIIVNEFIINSDSKLWCVDEALVDEVSQESYEESLNLDAFSGSDDGESIGSYDHLQCLNVMKTSTRVDVQEEEAEPALVQENTMLFETPFDNLNKKSLTNEDEIAVTEDQVADLENSNENIITLRTVDSGKEPHSECATLKRTEAECRNSRKVKAENGAKLEMEDSALARITTKSKKLILERDELDTFNPRAPNFLPLEPDPEAEKVDLRHQDLEEKKNSEEWMVDYALRQVVTKLAPARKRKVALLVEAFEKVMPISKCDLHLRNNTSLDQARPIQACS